VSYNCSERSFLLNVLASWSEHVYVYTSSAFDARSHEHRQDLSVNIHDCIGYSSTCLYSTKGSTVVKQFTDNSVRVQYLLTLATLLQPFYTVLHPHMYFRSDSVGKKTSQHEPPTTKPDGIVHDPQHPRSTTKKTRHPTSIWAHPDCAAVPPLSLPYRPTSSFPSLIPEQTLLLSSYHTKVH
jgi:hypothetical protein